MVHTISDAAVTWTDMTEYALKLELNDFVYNLETCTPDLHSNYTGIQYTNISRLSGNTYIVGIHENTKKCVAKAYLVIRVPLSFLFIFSVANFPKPT